MGGGENCRLLLHQLQGRTMQSGPHAAQGFVPLSASRCPGVSVPSGPRTAQWLSPLAPGCWGASRHQVPTTAFSCHCLWPGTRQRCSLAISPSCHCKPSDFCCLPQSSPGLGRTCWGWRQQCSPLKPRAPPGWQSPHPWAPEVGLELPVTTYSHRGHPCRGRTTAWVRPCVEAPEGWAPLPALQPGDTARRASSTKPGP